MLCQPGLCKNSWICEAHPVQSYMLCSVKRATRYWLRHPYFKQQHLVYLKAPPGKTESQNPCIQWNISRETSVLCSNILKSILGKAYCRILMSLQPSSPTSFKGASTEKSVIVGLHLYTGYIIFCSLHFIEIYCTKNTLLKVNKHKSSQEHIQQKPFNNSAFHCMSY